MKIGLIAHPEELTKREIDEIRAAGADVPGLHPVGRNKATSSLENLLKWLKTDEGRGLLSYARSPGLEIEYEMHAANFLVPRGLFTDHPEYFRESRGVRTPDYNFCVRPAKPKFLNPGTTIRYSRTGLNRPKKFTPDNQRIAREIEFYRSLGVSSISSFACYLGSDYEALYGMPDFSAIGRK